MSRDRGESIRGMRSSGAWGAVRLVGRTVRGLTTAVWRGAPQRPACPGLRRRRAGPAPAPAHGALSSGPRRQLSDLDIQIAHSPQLGLPSDRGPRAPRAGLGPSRCGRVISNTVDSWARQPVRVRDGAYKPIVFGGTYPIEVPASPPEEPQPLKPAIKKIPVAMVRGTLAGEAHRRQLRRTIERSLDKFEAILANREMSEAARRKAFSKRTVETFDIDEPLGPGASPEAAARDEEAKYYVSGPKTFNIDEPVSFI